MLNSMLGGRYRIEKPIGEGGGSKVYLAVDEFDGNQVAIKMLKDINDQNIDALIDEYKFAALHTHPFLLNPLALNYKAEKPFTVLPYVHGATAESWLNDNSFDINNDEHLIIFRDICAKLLEAVSFIHYCDYLYNDFKPSNLMLIGDLSGHQYSGLKIIDFNLVSKLGEDSTKRGTLEYIAPEVVAGNKPDFRADLYSIGATLYEIITGHAVFGNAQNGDLIKLITETGIIDFSGIPEEFIDGISALLNRDPEQRPSNAEEAAKILGSVDKFYELRDSHIEYYLAAGLPFHDDDSNEKFKENNCDNQDKILQLRITANFKQSGQANIKTASEITADSVSALLKTNPENFDIEEITRVTGGDPVIIFYLLKSSYENGFFDLSTKKLRPDSWDHKIESNQLNKYINRKFSSLNNDERELLDVLSVWDGDIPVSLLSDSHLNANELVKSLVSKGYLRGENNFIAIASSIIREFIYNNLEDGTRKQNHLHFAKAIEENIKDDNKSVPGLAMHWMLTGDNVKGFEANVKAAKMYISKGDLNSAEEFGQNLLTLADNGGGPEITALMIYADILKSKGDYTKARLNYLKLLRALQSSDDDIMMAKVYKDLGDLYRSTRLPRKSIYYTQKAFEKYDSLTDSQGMANCLNNLGLAYWIKEEYQQALKLFTKAFKVNNEIGNNEELAKIQTNIAIIYDITGQADEVASGFQSALNYANRAENPRLEALISNNLGYFYLRQGVFDKAEPYLLEALGISEKIGYTEEVINSLSNLGLCYLRMGKLFKSADYNSRAREMAKSFGNHHLMVESEIHLAEVATLMGNFSLADNVLTAIEKDDVYSEDNTLRVQTELRRARLCLAFGDIACGFERASTLFDAADDKGDVRTRLEAKLIIAESSLYTTLNNPVDQLKTTIEAAEKHGLDDLAVEAELLLVRKYIQDGGYLLAERLLDQVVSARSSFTKKTSIEVEILQSELYGFDLKYDNAIELLEKNEAIAGASGFIPLALTASITLSEIFSKCGKTEKQRAVIDRANIYREKLIAALPKRVSKDSLLSLSIFKRIDRMLKQNGNQFVGK